MFKCLLVLFCAFAAAVAKPGYLHGGYGGYGLGLPVATSYSNRYDVHSKPIITTYAAAPVVKTLVAAPLSYGYSAGIPISSGYGYGHGIHDYSAGVYDGYGSYGHGWY